MTKKSRPKVNLGEDNQQLIKLIDERFKKLETMIAKGNSKTTIPDIMQPKEICNKFG